MLMSYISFIIELKELFIYSGYKYSGKYINYKYIQSVLVFLFLFSF